MEAQHNDNTEFLIAELGQQLFAFETGKVASALAPRTVTPLPFVPAHVEGLVNVNDRVMTLINLSVLFGLQGPANGAADSHTEHGRSELMVLETLGVPCAVRVDRVVGRADVSAEELDLLEQEQDDFEPAGRVAMNTTACGRFQYQGREVLVLDADGIGSLLVPEDVPAGDPGLLGRQARAEEADSLHLQTCLRFRLGNEHYALRLPDVTEILNLGASTPLPGTPAEVEGIVAVRNEALLVLSLRNLLAVDQTQTQTMQSLHEELVVIEVEGERYALRVDQIIGTDSFDPERAQAIDDRQADIAAVLMLDGDLVSLLEPARLVTPERQQLFSRFAPARREQRREEQKQYVPLLEVRLGNDLVAVPLDLVQAIADQGDFEALEQEEQPLISGAVHLKGDIVPVVDFGKLLKCQGHTPITQHQSGKRIAWVVVRHNNESWAIPAAEARQIQHADASAIERIDDRRQRFIESIAHHQGRLLPVLSLTMLAGSGREESFA